MNFIEAWRLRRDINLIALIVFLLHVALVFPVFFPHLGDIGVWDEAQYINEGRELMGGKLPTLAANPAVATFYALTYLPVHASPYWLVHSCSIGRFVLFGLLWLASFLVACQLEELASPFIIIALVTVSPVLPRLLNNGSNALFTAMSGFALWQFLSFQRTRSVKHLWLCSLFLGGAALSRNEGPVLFVVFLGLALALCIRARVVRQGLTASIVPFAIIMGGYLLIYGLCMGDFKPGIAERGYGTFEQGHGMAFAESYGTKQFYVEGQLDARRIFGTAEENHFSVLTAIRRNPTAYLQRILPLTKHAVEDMFRVYAWYFGLLVFMFAARGIVDLVERKLFTPLVTLLLWPAYSVLYVLLCYQPAHLLMPFLSVLSLASVGISAFSLNLAGRRERYVWSIGLLAGAIALAGRGMVPNGPLTATLIILLGLWLIWLTADRYRGVANIGAIGCLLLLAIGLILRFGLTQSEARTLGSNGDEQAVTYLSTHFERGTRIGAWGPGKMWTAKMDPVTMAGALRYLKSAEDVSGWMARERIQAIYVDDNLREFEPDVLSLLQKQIGGSLSVAFDAEQGAVQILIPTSSP